MFDGSIYLVTSKYTTCSIIQPSMPFNIANGSIEIAKITKLPAKMSKNQDGTPSKSSYIPEIICNIPE